MAIYHLSVKIVGRSSGRSAVAAAAYRAGDIITNQYDGVTHDYSNKHWIDYSEIMLPANAPKEYMDRSSLWNSVELAEKSKDAQLAREIEVALPIELGLSDQINLVERFVKHNFVKEGMCADFSIHTPPLRNDRGQPIDKRGNIVTDKKDMLFQNPHAHILLTMRAMDKNGKWEPKTQIEYICKKGNQEKAFTAKEFKSAKEDGWEKQYKFKDGNKKVWLTMKEGQEKNLTRINKTPKTSKYGRRNPTTEKWNNLETEKAWRKQWEVEVNQKLKECGFSATVDCRSYKDQGRVYEIPSVHMGAGAGYTVKRMERQGKNIQNELYLLNKLIKEHNLLVQRTNIRIEELNRQIEKITKESIDKIDILKSELRRNLDLRDSLNLEIKNMDTELTKIKNIIERTSMVYTNVVNENKKSNEKILALAKEINQLGVLSIGRKNELNKKMDIEKKSMDDRKAHLTNVLKQYDMISFSDVNNLIQEVQELDEDKAVMVSNLMHCMEQIKNLAYEYIELVETMYHDGKQNDIIQMLDGLKEDFSIKDIEKITNTKQKMEYTFYKK